MRLCLMLLIGTVITIAGCTSSATDSSAPPQILANGEPSAITVQHCLIGFSGSVGDKTILRSKEEAGLLAASLLDQLKSGADFDAIIKENTDDSPPGIYKMVNSGLPADKQAKVYSRDRMVPAFGNVGFNLNVGEYGMSEYDPQTSKYGWHIIKRLK